MRIVVPVKHVPEPTARWRLSDDLTLDRAGVEGRLSQLDEYAVEQAVRLVEGGLDAEIVYLTMGPAPAVDALRLALAMGGDRAVHVVDDALHGSDALATSLVLATAIRRIGFDLVICGMASTDGEMSVLPSMIADRLGVPEAALARELHLGAGTAADGTDRAAGTGDADRAPGTVTVQRETEAAVEEVVAQLPAVVSVTDQTGEARYPTFRTIMAARRKPIDTWSLADLGLPAAAVGAEAARVVVSAAQARPPRQAGTVINDGDDAVRQLADFLADRQLI